MDQLRAMRVAACVVDDAGLPRRRVRWTRRGHPQHRSGLGTHEAIIPPIFGGEDCDPWLAAAGCATPLSTTVKG